MSITYYHGYQGSVRFNATGASPAAVTRVISWSININKDIREVTRITDTYKKVRGGLISGSGSIELIYTGENNSFIEAVNTAQDSGAAAFELYLDTNGNKRITFTGIIDTASYGTNTDDVQKISCTFVTNGPITLEI